MLTREEKLARNNLSQKKSRLRNRIKLLEKAKLYRENNFEKISIYNKNYRIKKRENHLYKNAKYRAKKWNLEFNIAVSDIVIPEVCPVLNISILDHSPNNEAAPSLDRINNNLGYIVGNVRVISYRANIKKSDLSFEEIELLYLDMLRLRESGKL